MDGAEGGVVRSIFARCYGPRSIPAGQGDLRSRGIASRVRTIAAGRTIGGVALTNGPIAHILRKRMYLGETKRRSRGPVAARLDGHAARQSAERLDPAAPPGCTVRRTSKSERASSVLPQSSFARNFEPLRPQSKTTANAAP